jgi:Flp pilus assembly protein TadG
MFENLKVIQVIVTVSLNRRAASNMINKNTKIIKNFLSNARGNVALTFAILAVPIFGAVGTAIDYARVSSEKSNVQNSMDAALLAGVNETQKLLANGKAESEAIATGKKIALEYYNIALSDRKTTPGGNFDPMIAFDGDAIKGSAKFDGIMKTSLSTVLGITQTNYTVDTTVNISRPEFVEIYFVVDNSNSMGIGASQGDVQRMTNSQMACAFACHTPSDSRHTPHVRDTMADARALGVNLRIDVITEALKELLDSLGQQQLGVQVKTAVYTASNTLVEEHGLSENITDVRNSLDDVTLANDWETGGTSLDYVLEELEDEIGISGDGFSQNNAKKMVVLITDGVQSNFKYKRGTVDQYAADPNFEVFRPTYGGNGRTVQSIQGFNPKMCDNLKSRNKAEVYTVNIEYTIPRGRNIDHKFTAIRDHLKDDIVDNLSSCASDDENFFTADTPEEIFNTFDDLVSMLLKSDLLVTQ